MIDVGVNFSSSQLRADTAALLSQARQAGVTAMLATGTSLEVSREALALAEREPTVWATAGVHPHKASTWDGATAVAVSALIARARVVAVGECGLDYNRMLSPRQAQLTAFAAHLELAERHQKPLFLHCRDAFQDFHGLLSDAPALPGVVHCFTGNRSQARALLDLGLDLGVTGWVCDERRGGDLRDAVQFVPLDRLHLETDAPYLMPHNIPGADRRGRNVPANLPWVAQELARLKGLPVDEVAAACTANSRRLFRLEQSCRSSSHD